MITNVKIKIMSIAENIHFRIFGHEMGDLMRDFLGHLSWSFFGGIISAGIMFVLNILAGRWLGPVEYGKYSLVLALSYIFIIPMTLGIDTAITYFVAKNNSEIEKRESIASVLWVAGIFIGGVSLLIFGLSLPISKLFSTEMLVVTVAIMFSMLLAMRNIFDAIVKGMHFFQFQSKIRIGESLVVFAAFLLLVEKLNFLTFKSYVIAILIGYIFTNVAVIFRIKNLFRVNTKYTKKMLLYGSYAIVGSIYGILTNSFDKVLINKFIGPEQLGIYNAYMTASFLIVSQFMILFINVFFPYLASIRDATSLMKKINKLALIFSVPCFLILYFVTWIAMSFFGKEYRMDYLLIGEFSFLGVATMYFTVLWWLIASRGAVGIRFTSFNGIVAGLIFICLMVIFRNMLTLQHVVVFLIIASSYAIIKGNLNYARIK